MGSLPGVHSQMFTPRGSLPEVHSQKFTPRGSGEIYGDETIFVSVMEGGMGENGRNMARTFLVL